MTWLSPSTWNRLGLGVAATWVALGCIGIFQPVHTAEIFGVTSRDSDTNETNYRAMGLLLGSRDVAIAAALFILGRAGRNREMGAVILSTLIICATDIYLVRQSRRYQE